MLLDLEGDEESAYVRQPARELVRDYFAEPFQSDLRLPDDAVDTGYTCDGQHLWLSADKARAYVGTEASVELWPQTVHRLGCA